MPIGLPVSEYGPMTPGLPGIVGCTMAQSPTPRVARAMNSFTWRRDSLSIAAVLATTTKTKCCVDHQYGQSIVVTVAPTSWPLTKVAVKLRGDGRNPMHSKIAEPSETTSPMTTGNVGLVAPLVPAVTHS